MQDDIREIVKKTYAKPEYDYLLRGAVPGDEKEILDMLQAAGLTTAGVSGNMQQFTVADNGEIMGAIGMVPDDAGSVLLRSLIVKEKYRNAGIADALLQAALKSGSGPIKTAYLLTYTAEKYFAKRGYKKIERTDIPCVLLEKSLQGEACSDCSTCMKRELDKN